MKINILDYNCGNIWSVKNAFNFLGYETNIIKLADQVLDSDCLILPGDGSFKIIKDMRNNNLILSLFILSQLTVVLEGKAKFSDRQVATMIPKYFARDHNSPKITRTRVYAEDSKKVTESSFLQRLMEKDVVYSYDIKKSDLFAPFLLSSSSFWVASICNKFGFYF